MRLSPTNLGMLLDARVAAVHLGELTLEEFAFQTRQTLESVAELPAYRGHLYNWYDITTGEPLEPRFVSTVDSGNLAAALWTLERASLGWAEQAPDPLAADLRAIAAACAAMVREMDFRFLFDRRRKVLSVGCHGAEGAKPEASCYDLLASEARIAAFIAVAKGDIPQESWFHLGRAHTQCRGERVLLSWTGTLFEYLMPALWMRHYPGTILERSVRAALRVQRDYARRKGVPWGISEAACIDERGEPRGYGPFGAPELAVKRIDRARLVIAPYASFLALGIEAAAALENLRRMEEYGWTGRYGFYESIDYRHDGGTPVRAWMAHHQGMSLLAAVNLLRERPFERHFHAEPQVMATELLLQERAPRGALAESEESEAHAA
jgi:cyclic beta-1,2-glucan synthetase